MSATADAEGEVGAYFRAIEDAFIALRGAPLLLSPEDWQTARNWHEQGVPLDLVRRVMEEVFERLRERDPDKKIHSLRYCAPAVESAWKEIRELGAAAGRLEPEPVDVAARLTELERSLPDGLPGRSELAAELTAVEGSAEAVEAALQELESSWLSRATVELDPVVRSELEERVESAIARLGPRVSAEARPELERRMLRQMVRQHHALPSLSLFG